MAARKYEAIKRRTYYSPGPNYTWHADGNHDLFHFGFLVHGSIDGYSRFVVWLKCRTSNTAATVAQLFVDAILEYGMHHFFIVDLYDSVDLEID